ncbi:MAG: aminotransferase class I/II-fold pyridoxal phosphate-dependent enzyme, partial [Paracoccaceae bacterium]
AYGLAGARVGYGIGHKDLIRAFDKVRNHFGMSRLGQAGALAALGDSDHLARFQGFLTEARAEISRIARANGLTPLPSATNFVTIDTGTDGAFARRLVGALADRGIFVRMPFVAPQDRCIRVSCGRPAALSAFAEALPAALAAARPG